jgi:aspartokinase/homoserine dehydrogenase 1
MTPFSGRGPPVLKFGGAALGSEDNLRRVLERLRRLGGPCVVVVSARYGVTNRLVEFLSSRPTPARRQALWAELRRSHPGLGADSEWLWDRLKKPLTLFRGPPRVPGWLSDAILATGERLAAHWFADRLERSGMAAQPVEADRLGLRTDATHGGATVHLEESRRAVRRGIERILQKGRLPVVTGFLGRGPDGRVTTLGRGGSDYSATCLASILGSPWVELVKEEASILTADPRIVPQARPLRQLTYEEAEELAQFGARVLHPMTIEPARLAGLEVRVASLQGNGDTTQITPDHGDRPPARALAGLENAALLQLRVPGGRQRKGVLAEVSDRLKAANVNVITLFTSSVRLLAVVEPSQARQARDALGPLAYADGATLEGPRRVGLVTAIGEGILQDLESLPPAVTGAALGMSATPRSLSLALPPEAFRRTLRELHKSLVENLRRGEEVAGRP